MSIRLEDVTYTYMRGTPFEKTALQHVSLSIEEGSFVAIAGHTGSGKSTLVQHLAGLIAPTGGRVLVDDVDLSDTSRAGKAAAKEARRKVGMVFQYPEHQLFEETVEADIAFGPRNLGCPEKEIAERVHAAMELVGLDYETYHAQPPFQMSGGQKRRAAIAGVLAMKPKYLILDEPTAGLDPAGREKMLKEIRALHKKHGFTIVLVSHSMEDIARFAERMLVLRKGTCVLDDAPSNVFRQTELLEQSGLRPPQVTSFLQMLRQKGLDVSMDAITFEDGLEAVLKAVKHRQ